MDNQKFKTNIKCMGCISAVTPLLNEKVGENKWQVDLTHEDKTLTIPGDVKAEELVAALKNIGYEAQIK